MNERDVEGFFIWDFEKERLNIVKRGVNFRTAMLAFLDPGFLMIARKASALTLPLPEGEG
jgi:uncharacterized DUF497 family protein